MKFLNKIKSLLSKKQQDQETASIVVRSTRRQSDKEPVSYKAGQWAAVLETRRNRGLRTDRAQRHALRARISTNSRRRAA